MREHGVLERALLVYEAASARFDHGDLSAVATVAKTATLLRRFIEDYHEKLEEQYVFPRVAAAGKLTDLVATLKAQHDRGRALTDQILQITQPGSGSSPAAEPLSGLLRAYIRMYRPHAAREDTVLFPAFKEVVRGREYDELGERFEEKEHALFGEHGFESVVQEIGTLEEALGIGDLASFTPH